MSAMVAMGQRGEMSRADAKGRRISRRLAALGGGWLVLLTVSAPCAGGELAWHDAFPISSAPSNVYFQARYRDARGDQHRLEVWREGEMRLRRKTDEAIDFSVERSVSGPDLYRVVDHARGIVIAADRAVFHRTGLFVNWRGLAHVLDVPRGPYRVVPFAGVSETVHGPCAWFRLATTQPSPATIDVCWSRQWGLPLIMKGPDAAESVSFRVEDVRRFSPDESTFAAPRQEELLRIDAGQGETSLD